MSLPALLSFYDPDVPWPPLRYGDTVAIIPDGVNGLMAYSGSTDARPWVEILQEGATLPPNVRDCHFRIISRHQYVESKMLQKMQKSGQWDGGRSLPLPATPEHGEDLKTIAALLCQEHSLPDEYLVQELLTRLKNTAEEKEGNESETKRQQGQVVRFGDAIELQHVTTGKIISLSKQQAYERAAKKLDMVVEGSEASTLSIRPAVKAYATGELVGSGDLVVLNLIKKIAGFSYSVHLGAAENEKWQATIVKATLKVTNQIVIGAFEVNATAGERPSAFRLVQFEPFHFNPMNVKRFKDISSRFRSEEIVCFYHKEAEAYLTYRRNLGNQAVFRTSNRTAIKSRKKASWMWKVEAQVVYNAGSHIVCADSSFYRIKHIVSNRYLIQNGDKLEVTDDYLAPGTLFSFRSFAKTSSEEFVHNLGLIYIRTQTGRAIQQHFEEDTVSATSGADSPIAVGIDPYKETLAELSPPETVSERDALLIMPVLPASVASVIEIRRAMLVLHNYTSLLEAVDETFEELTDAAGPSTTPPKELEEEASKVVEITQSCYSAVTETLTRLILNASIDEDPDPFSRDGAPNRLMQKLLRELEAIPLVMQLVQLPFSRGISLDWMASGDPRLEKLKKILNLGYRLLKQIVKGDTAAAVDLHHFLPILLQQQGRGLANTITLKELFIGKRKLLSSIGPDLIQLFMDLLTQNKDPRYIDFLLSICTVGEEPLPAVQTIIATQLFEKNPQLLPRCQLETGPGQPTRLKFLIPASKVTAFKKGSTRISTWLNVADFNDLPLIGSKDRASHILTAPFDTLEESEKMLRYFIRFTNLSGKIAVGRNQTALKFLLTSDTLSFKFDQLYAILSEESIPVLIRARLTSLTMRIHVDRDPQASLPQVLYSRTWTNLEQGNIANTERVIETVSAQTLPTAGKHDLEKLSEFFLEQLADLAGAKARPLPGAKEGTPSLNFEPTYGQLELLSAQIAIVDLLVDYGFYSSNRDSVDIDFTKIRTLFARVFAVVDTAGTPEGAFSSTRREAVMLIQLRSAALVLLIRMLNLRANYRISVMLHTWEAIFARMTEKGATAFDPLYHTHVANMGSFAATRTDLMKKTDQSRRLDETFAPHAPLFKECVRKCLDENIISNDEIRSDTYSSGKFQGDKIVEAMISLTKFKNPQLSGQACALMIRHMAQRTRMADDLAQVQLLVFSAQVEVYHDTVAAVKKLTGLKKHLFNDRPEAYTEAGELLATLTRYITVSAENNSSLVKENQRIMLNRELDEPILNILRLNLERDRTRRLLATDPSDKDTDPAVNEPRRRLFQACYDFLLSLCAGGNKAAQQKLFSQIGVFQEHVGIDDLNVADTICEIVRDNTRLVQMVPETLFHHFIVALQTWGRKARWLRFFEVFLFRNGAPFKRNQDLILRLLVDAWDAVIDLQCDYRDSQHLPKRDPRSGMTRLQLIKSKDHHKRVGSLVRYHCASIDLLAHCAVGKNPVNQVRIMMRVSLERIIENVLGCGLRPDGTVETDIDLDGVFMVRGSWLRLMNAVYLKSLDSETAKQVQEAARFWGSETNDQSGLMVEVVVDITLLAQRLKEIAPPSEGILTGISDSRGCDLSAHMDYIREVLLSLHTIYSRDDLYDYTNPGHVHVSSELRGAVALLFLQVQRVGRAKDAMLIVDVVEVMAAQGIRGALIEADHFDGEDTRVDAHAPKPIEMQFLQGWTSFRHQLVTKHLNIIPEPDKKMQLAIYDLALMLGSRGSFANDKFQTLAEFIHELCHPECDYLVLLNGLKTVRAILYLQPDKDALALRLKKTDPKRVAERQELEYRKMEANAAPADAETQDRFFVTLQAQIARLGGVELVIACISSEDEQTVLEGLRLAVTMMEGGNAAVQDRFATALGQAHSYAFFQRIYKVREDAVKALKDFRKKIKQLQTEYHALRFADVKITGRFQPPALGNSLLQILELIKMMRRMCMGQHKGMQDILRKQRLNKSSFNFFEEAILFAIALEPELQDAIAGGDEVTMEGAIRGFLMLADATRGPNHANQLSIAQPALFDLMDRLFAKMFHQDKPTMETLWRQRGEASATQQATEKVLKFKESADSEGEMAPKAGNENSRRTLLTVRQVSMSRQQTLAGLVKSESAKSQDAQHAAADRLELAQMIELSRWRNNIRARLKIAATTCILAVVEGGESQIIPHKVLTTLQWTGIAEQMNSCYQSLKKQQAGAEEDAEDLKERAQLFEEGILYCFCLKYMVAYDEDNQYILPAIKPHRQAMKYFSHHTGYVEIVRDKRLERLFFQLPDACLPGGPLDQPFVEMYDTDRSEVNRKNLQFIDNLVRLIKKEEHNSLIRASRLAFCVTRWGAICKATFWLSLLIHLLLICSSYSPEWLQLRVEQRFAERVEAGLATEAEAIFHDSVTPVSRHVAFALSGLLLLLCLVRAVAFCVGALPNILRVALEVQGGAEPEEVIEEEENSEASSPGRFHKKEEDDESDDDLVDPADRDLFAATAVRAEVLGMPHTWEGEQHKEEAVLLVEEAKQRWGGSVFTWKAAKAVASSPWCWYEALLFLSVLVAFVVNEPSIALWPLFEMCSWKGSKTVIDAIKFNAGKMIQTFLLGLLVMYVWLVVGIWTLQKHHAEEYCSNMFQCFFAYLFNSMRGEGLRDVMVDAVFWGNLADMAWQEGNMLFRVLWDMAFQFVFLYILIAIITGIVIDAFSGLRDEKEAADQDLQTKCFVCNLDRFTLDQKGQGFDKHIQTEHNPRWYLFFLLHLYNARPRSKLTGQEMHVLRKVWPEEQGQKRSFAWLPREKTVSLVDDGEEGQRAASEVHDQLAAMAEQLQTLTQAAGEERKTLQAILSTVAPSTFGVASTFGRSNKQLHPTEAGIMASRRASLLMEQASGGSRRGSMVRMEPTSSAPVFPEAAPNVLLTGNVLVHDDLGL